MGIRVIMTDEQVKKVTKGCLEQRDKYFLPCGKKVKKEVNENGLESKNDR
ncbi:hypothetical protein ABEY52_26730 [Priestia aryabhattai]